MAVRYLGAGCYVLLVMTSNVGTLHNENLIGNIVGRTYLNIT